jgi:hypothetical protein
MTNTADTNTGFAAYVVAGSLFINEYVTTDGGETEVGALREASSEVIDSTVATDDELAALGFRLVGDWHVSATGEGFATVEPIQ